MTWGKLLRKVRERKGVTQAQLAEALMTHQTMISHLELGKIQPDELWAKRLDDALEAGGLLLGAYQLVEPFLAQPHPNSDAYEGYRKAEARATRVYDLSLGRPHGMLQSEQYMRALFGTHNPSEPSEHIEARVRERLARQSRLVMPDGPHLVSVIEEAVLWRVVGGSEVTRVQFEFLLARMQLPNVVIQVLPFGMRESASAPMSGMVILEPASGPKRVYSESLVQGHFIDSPRRVSAYVNIFDRVRAQALPEKESAELIRHIMEHVTDDGASLEQEQPLGRRGRPVRRVRPAVRYPRRRPRA
jgi:transcriptional regulator with XRE-family HTH domain